MGTSLNKHLKWSYEKKLSIITSTIIAYLKNVKKNLYQFRNDEKLLSDKYFSCRTWSVWLSPKCIPLWRWAQPPTGTPRQYNITKCSPTNPLSHVTCDHTWTMYDMDCCRRVTHKKENGRLPTELRCILALDSWGPSCQVLEKHGSEARSLGCRVQGQRGSGLGINQSFIYLFILGNMIYIYIRLECLTCHTSRKHRKSNI